MYWTVGHREVPSMLYGLASVFALMLLKEAGVPIPVPADLIMVGVAARAATGQWSLPAVILTVVSAMVIGGTIQFLVARGPARRALLRFGRYLGLTPPRLERAAGTLQRGGITALVVALATPGVRAASIAAAGLADVRLGVFLPALLIGDSVFFLLHVAIGYAGGRGLDALVHSSGHTGIILLGALTILALGGLTCWILLRRGRGATASAGPAAIGAWVEASCPVCLAVAALQERSEVVSSASAQKV
jgi:membrane protein DedA with SNARE-associated domain